MRGKRCAQIDLTTRPVPADPPRHPGLGSQRDRSSMTT